MPPERSGAKNPFEFLRKGGAYETGKFGWRVLPLSGADGKRYAVFATKITVEDLGEQLFEYGPAGIGRLVPESQTFGFRVAKHEFDVSFDLQNKIASISDRLTLERSDPAAKAVFMRISPHYRLSKITDTTGRNVAFAQASGVVSFLASPGKTTAYRVRYAGKVNLPGYAGAITADEASLTDDYWWLSIGRQPAPYTIRVSAPANWTIVAQGERTNETVQAGVRSVTSRMDLPVSYYSLSAGRYKAVERVIEGRAFRAYSLTKSQEQMEQQADLNAPILRFFNSIAPYPFSWWGTLESPAYGGGALEAYSYATYGSGIPEEDAHEPSHTWWGGIIPNSYLRSLWNESFASYSEGLYQREGGPTPDASRRLAFIVDTPPNPAYNLAPVAQAGAEIGPEAAAIGYGKGAAVLQMLETQIGPSAMMKCLQTWAKEHPRGTLGEWEQFQKVVARVTGDSQKAFFDDWLRRPGWLDFDVSSVAWKEGVLTATGVFKSEPYRMKYEAWVEDASGSGRLLMFDNLQMSEGKRFTMTLDSPQKPSLVSIDPYRRLLRKVNPNERPLEFEPSTGKLKPWVQSGFEASAAALAGFRLESSGSTPPSDLAGLLLVGDPALPAIAELAQKAGFVVIGSKLTYQGVTIDLNNGFAFAVMELSPGRIVGLALGTPKRQPEVGRARVAIGDGLGRFLRGQTEPKRTGALTFRIE